MQTLFQPTCVLVGGAGRSGTTILGSIIASHPQAAMLIEDSLTTILRSVQMLASVRTVPEEVARAALFGVPKSFMQGPFSEVRQELERLSSIDGYRVRFAETFRHVMELCCGRRNSCLFGSKSVLAKNWEDLPYLRAILADLRIVLIVRNPFNVVASSLRRRDNALIGLDVWPINSVDEAAAEWHAAMQTMARVVQDQFTPVLVVKYEELCTQPVIVKDIYQFLGLVPFGDYPDLWARGLEDTRATLNSEDVAYLRLRFPSVDDVWHSESPYKLLERYSTA